MLSFEEFRRGQISLPVDDADDLPPGCFACHFLYGKEFSVGEGVTHLCCGYLLGARQPHEPHPVCLPEGGGAAKT